MEEEGHVGNQEREENAKTASERKSTRITSTGSWRQTQVAGPGAGNLYLNNYSDQGVG